MMGAERHAVPPCPLCGEYGHSITVHDSPVPDCACGSGHKGVYFVMVLPADCPACPIRPGLQHLCGACYFRMVKWIDSGQPVEWNGGEILSMVVSMAN